MAYVLHSVLAILALGAAALIAMGVSLATQVIIEFASAGTNETKIISSSTTMINESDLGHRFTTALNTSTVGLDISDHLNTSTPGPNISDHLRTSGANSSDHLNTSTPGPKIRSNGPILPLLSSNSSTDPPPSEDLRDVSNLSPIFFDILGLPHPHAGQTGQNSSECRETPFLILHGFPIRNFLCKEENGLRRADKLLQPGINEANQQSVTHAYENYMPETVVMDIRAASCTSAALENLNLLLSKPWKHLLILSLSVDDRDCLPIIVEKVDTCLKAPSLQVLSINFLDASNPSHVKTVTSVFDSLRPKKLLQLSLTKFVDEGSSGFVLDHEVLSSPVGGSSELALFRTERIVLRLESEASEDAQNRLFVPHLKDQSIILMQRSTKCVDLNIDFGITSKMADDITYAFTANDAHFCRAHYRITVPRFNETVVAPIFPGDLVHIRVHALEKAAPRTKVTLVSGTSSLPTENFRLEFGDTNVKRVFWDLRPTCPQYETWRDFERNVSVLNCYLLELDS